MAAAAPERKILAFREALKAGDLQAAQQAFFGMVDDSIRATNSYAAVRIFAKELLTLANAKQGLPNQVKPAQVTLSMTTATATVDVTFDSSAIFLLRKISGYVAINDFSVESQAVSAIGNPSLQDRLLMKAMNCRFTLRYKEGGNQRRIVDTADRQMPLSAIMQGVLGGGPMLFDPPELVFQKDIITGDFGLQDTATDVVGSASIYGVLLDGVNVDNPNC